MARESIPRTLFGRRLREVRNRMGIAQDKLGVLIGMDESCSSARMSRYESGVHEPAFETAQKIAAALNIPAAYFYCEDDTLAKFIVAYSELPENKRKEFLQYLTNMLPNGL